MAFLPNMQEDENRAEEAVGGAGRSRGFGAGFLLGVLSALVCIVLFVMGWFFAQWRTDRREARIVYNLDIFNTPNLPKP